MIDKLPAEIVFHISDQIPRCNTIASLLLVNRRLQRLLTVCLYARGAEMTDCSPIIWAIANDNVRILELLLLHGANPKTAYRTTEHEREPALFFAIRHGSIEMVQLLLDHGADINATFHARSPLYVAASYSSEDMVRFLFERGARADAGSLPLLFTAVQRRAEASVLRLLLENGAKASACGWGWCTPLAALICFPTTGRRTNSDTEAVELLLKYGADPNDKSYVGTMPLHMAALRGDFGVIKALVKYGADIEAEDVNGATPFECWLRTQAAGRETFVDGEGPKDGMEICRLLKPGAAFWRRRARAKMALDGCGVEGHDMVGNAGIGRARMRSGLLGR
ncbi:ankyrin repeat-containing domain protein [Trichophaea hybrida]|nr:ankyrin repeat-containing domain protein [Trichophaea hybrida]